MRWKWLAVAFAALQLGCGAAMERAAERVAGRAESDPYGRESGRNAREESAPEASARPQAQQQTQRTPEPAPIEPAEPAPQAPTTTAGVAPAEPAPVAPAIPQIDFGEYHALVVGNAAYQHLPALATTRNDAEAVATLLTDDYGFSVKVLTDATRAEVMAELSRLRRVLSERDNLLVYYAGHGWNDRDAGEAYWLPIDARPDDQTAWISNATITQMIRAMRAKHVMIVADSCYSGTLTRGIQVQQKDPGYVRRLSERRARTALTSGGNEPVADTGSDGHSVFANAFLSALAENRGVLDGTELYTAVRRPVMLNARQTPQYGDIRLAGHEDGDFLFVRR